MRLLQREPETPSLETWLSRDVPHEREMASETLDRLGREKALQALLALHNREGQRLWGRQRAFQQTQAVLTVTAFLLFIAAWQWPDKFYNPFVIGFSFTTLVTAIALVVAVGLHQYNVRLKNTVVALFHYDDNPLVCEPFCRAVESFAFYGSQWELYTHLTNVLSVMPSDKNQLTKTARTLLRSRLDVWDNYLGWTSTERAQNADLQIAIVRYFARTNDRDAVPVLRKLLKRMNNPWLYGENGERVQEAAHATLQAFSESLA